MNYKKIKLLITHKKYSKILNEEPFVPIQTGRDISDEIFENMIGDNTGDNISKENNYFCELSAIYWAWKNYEKLDNPDYIGFMHNRRHFIFNNKHYKKHKKGFVVFPQLNESYIKECSLNYNDICEQLDEYDCIFPQPVKIGIVYKQFEQEHDVKYLDLALDIIKKKYPDYTDIANEYINSDISYVWCMGIYKKEIFFNYAKWLFDILMDIFSEIDFTGYNTEQARLPGYIGERLTGIFFKKLIQDNYKIKHLNVSFIQDIKEDYSPQLYPAFKNNNICIAVSSSNEYVPILATYLSSIIEHSSKNYNYDIIVFEHSITNTNKEILKRSFNNDNLSIRFYNPDKYIKNYKLHISLEYFKEECYFRIVAPLVLNNYDKILFTDIDLIYNEDPANLFKIDIENYPIAACKDYVFSALVNLNPQIKEYALKTIKLDNQYNYYNTGVMLFNVKEYLRENSHIKLLQLINDNEFKFQEQDALNHIFNKRIKTINLKWNYVVPDENWKNIFDSMPIKDIEEMRLYKNNPSIIHFSGPFKPWKGYKKQFYEKFIYNARKTPFYEDIIKFMLVDNQKTTTDSANKEFQKLKQEFINIHLTNINNRFAQNEQDIYTIFSLIPKSFVHFTMLVYKFKISILKKIKYKQRLDNVKALKRNRK